MTDTILFRARNILTMDPGRPQATHVAVRDGRILAVGGADCADPLGGAIPDDRFADAVLVPGFVEGHAHLVAAGIWEYAYAGYHDRIDPEGKLWRGKTDLQTVIADLRDYASGLAPDAPLIGWGFDPIFLPCERMNRHHLDSISTTRPVVLIHANLHVMYVNGVVLDMVGYDRHSDADGVMKDEDGELTGELREIAALFPVTRRMGIDIGTSSRSAPAIEAFGRIGNRVGVTTMTDLFSTLTPSDTGLITDVTGNPDYPLRIVCALGAQGGNPDEIAATALALRELSTDKLRMGSVKLMTDGSIQGWTARLKSPGYLRWDGNGLWNSAPEEIERLCIAMQKSRIQMHIHANGDEASEVALDGIEAAARTHPWADARHVIQHGQMMDHEQFKRCAALGVGVNLFANHLWYFGDQHTDLTLGEPRATRLDSCRSALDHGLTLAIHSDAPVTPLDPLFTAWCAVNRCTPTGRELGPEERITTLEALRAITLGPAETLKLDTEIGSISPGKRADFAVLGQDPAMLSPMELKDIPVLGTVFGGQAHLS